MMRVFLVVLLGSAGCVGPGLVTDGSSVAIGNHATGALRHGRRLPFFGEGYLVPKRWQDRQRNYGTDELVGLLVRSARRANRMHRNSVLGVADLSPLGGGSTPEHRSHRNGRDVDLLYYVTDLDGKPVTPTEMIPFDNHGMRSPPASLPATSSVGQPAEATLPAGGRQLDVARTWTLVKILVTDPQVSVQWIFMGRGIGQLLLQHARAKKEPAYVIDRAMAVMHQPSDAQSHMDHWHLRVFCAPSDRYQGCADRGPARWLKKDLKYVDSPPPAGPPLNLARLSLRPIGLSGL
jgi:penicillin-insensitive murein endopeptidase